MFRLLFMGNMNAVMMTLGALAVVVGGLPFWYAVAATTLGQLLASLGLMIVARVGVDHGLPGQVALRATFGHRGARLLTSPYRVAAASYWFATQAVAAALALSAISTQGFGQSLPVGLTAMCIGALQALLGIIGIHALRHFSRLILPSTVVFICVVFYILAQGEDARLANSDPATAFSWSGFALFVSVLWGGAASNVTNIADLCRYTRSRTAMRIGVLGGAVLSTAIATGLGAYVASIAVADDPFEILASMTNARVLLVILGVSILIQATAINVMNLYTAGLSLTNTAPRLGRVAATTAVSMLAIGISAFPSVLLNAEYWVRILGSLAAPLMGVIVADYAVVRRTSIDLAALYTRRGPYWYWRGLNRAAVVGTAVGAIAYALVPDDWIKAAWGVGAAGLAYLACRALTEAPSAPLQRNPRSAA
jgi:purine-cytosine permease-like protein